MACKTYTRIGLALIIVIATIFSSTASADNEWPFGGNSPGWGGFFDDLCSNLRKFLAGLGDPVYLRGGEYYVSAEDLRIRGRALDVFVERRYSSRSVYNSRFGYGWDLSYNFKVRSLKDPNTLVLLTGENRKLDYTLDPNSDPNEPVYRIAGSYDYLVAKQDGTYTLAKKHGTELDFDINGNLTSITDRNDNSITFTYDSNGLLPLYGPSEFFLDQVFGGPSDGRGLVAMSYKLTKITDDLTRDIDFTYDSNGLLSTITDFAGRTWTYDYNSVTNDLVSVTGPNTPEHASGLTTTYTYDANHNMLTITDPNSQTYVTNTYDSNDRVYQQTHGNGTYTFSYNPDSNQVTVTDRKGFDITSVYNDTGQPLSYSVDTNGLRAGDPNSYTTSYQYDPNIEITRKTFPAGNWIDYTYDANSNLLTVCREPNNGDPNIITSFTYDPNFNFVKTRTDPLGYVTTYAYDANGNLTSITYPTVSTPTGDANAVVSFTYNSYGQAVTSTAPDAIVTKYEYYTDVNDANNYGRLWKVTMDYNETDGNALNITTAYEYDVLGRIIEVNDPNGDLTSFVYNDLDQLTKTTAPSPYSYVTKFSYNDVRKLSQIEREISGPNQITSYTYNTLDNRATITDPLAYVTKYSHDNSENLSDANDAEDNLTQYDYDERDLLWKVTDANGNVTEYSYTLNGKVAEVNDPNDDATTYSYDGFDRLTCITYPDDTNETFGYDKNSNLTSFKNRNDQTIYYEYDVMNRMTVKNRPGDPNIVYRYDIAGRLYDVNDGRTVANGGGITLYSHNRIGKVTEVNDIESRVVQYEYNDERSLRTMLTYPDDTNVTYEYDELSRLTKISYEGSTAATFEYDELYHRTLLTLGNDANAVYEYDLGSRLLKLTNNVNDVNIILDYNNHDKIGNRLTCKIDDANWQVYTYDELYRLTNVDYNDGNTVSYTYDTLGNRTDVNENGSSTSYSRNNLNQYTSVGGTSYGYDNNGNLNDDGSYTYYYDSENRLTEIKNKGGGNKTIAKYYYDYAGSRIAKELYKKGRLDTTTKYCYDGDRVIAEYDDSDNLLRKFIYGRGIDEPIMMIDVDGETETKYYYHFDGPGSVVALSDTSTDIVERYSYKVFGEANTTSSIGNPYLFTGRRHDSEAGLYYYRARYYAHDIGRFLQPDPVGYSAGLNLYRYCGNNPLNCIDPYGLRAKGAGDALADGWDAWSNFVRKHFGGVPDWDKLHWMDKFGYGYYYGTGYGDEALDYWAQQYIESGTWYEKFYNGAGGFFSSLWQPGTYQLTLASLIVAGVANEMLTAPPSGPPPVPPVPHNPMPQNPAPEETPTPKKSPGELWKDYQENPDDWEEVKRVPDPKKGPSPDSQRAKKRHKETGEEFWEHDIPSKDHEHYWTPPPDWPH